MGVACAEVVSADGRAPASGGACGATGPRRGTMLAASGTRRQRLALGPPHPRPTGLRCGRRESHRTLSGIRPAAGSSGTGSSEVKQVRIEGPGNGGAARARIGDDRFLERGRPRACWGQRFSFRRPWYLHGDFRGDFRHRRRSSGAFVLVSPVGSVTRGVCHSGDASEVLSNRGQVRLLLGPKFGRPLQDQRRRPRHRRVDRGTRRLRSPVRRELRGRPRCPLSGTPPPRRPVGSGVDSMHPRHRRRPTRFPPKSPR